MPCKSENLPLPGFNNRWHVILYPTTYIPAPTVYRMATLVRDEAISTGATRMDIGFFCHFEIMPNDPGVQQAFRDAAGASETRPQRITINVLSYDPQVIELLIEEPTSDEVNHTASFTWLQDLAETFLLLGSVH